MEAVVLSWTTTVLPHKVESKFHGEKLWRFVEYQEDRPIRSFEKRNHHHHDDDSPFLQAAYVPDDNVESPNPATTSSSRDDDDVMYFL